MKRTVIFAVVALLLMTSVSAWGFAQKKYVVVADEKASFDVVQKVDYVPVTSIVIGGQYDFGQKEAADANSSGFFGISVPLFVNWTGGKCFAVIEGEAGKIDLGEEYNADARCVYFFSPVSKKPNIFAIIGPGVVWEDLQIGDAEQTTAFLTAITGMGIYYPATTNFGVWVAGEFKTGTDYQASRVGAGLTVFFGQ